MIRKQVESVLKGFGKGQIKDTVYRPLKYLIEEEIDGKTLLQNNITGELVVLNDKERAAFKALPSKFSEELSELIEHRFVVPQDFDEKTTVLNLRKVISLFFKKSEITSYTILPTTNCNARCFYCYEADLKKYNMSKETAEKVVNFIKKNHAGKKVTVSWFGGEPTLSSDRITQICNRLKEENIEYSSSMVSNGYLLKEPLAKTAKEIWKLRDIQITIDGTEEIYNNIKAYVGINESAYKTVLQNIGNLLENEIYVSVRMNLARHNIENLKELIAELSARFGNNKYFSAYVHPLFDNCGFKPLNHEMSEKIWLMEKQHELNCFIREKMISTGFGVRLPELKFSHCMADSDSAIIINPDGTLSKCEHCTEQKVGDLDNGITDRNTVSKFKEILILPECEDCPMFPNCINLKECFQSNLCFKKHREEKRNNYLYSMRKYYEKYLKK